MPAQKKPATPRGKAAAKVPAKVKPEVQKPEAQVQQRPEPKRLNTTQTALLATALGAAAHMTGLL